jgi:hypothetical protein
MITALAIVGTVLAIIGTAAVYFGLGLWMVKDEP